MISQAQHCDTQQIWSEFGDRLRAFIARRVASEADADDILQDVFLRIHRRAGDRGAPSERLVFLAAAGDAQRHRRLLPGARATARAAERERRPSWRRPGTTPRTGSTIPTSHHRRFAVNLLLASDR